MDDGGKETPLYSYTCECGMQRVKDSAFQYSYYDSSGEFLGIKAPECYSKRHNDSEMFTETEKDWE